MVECTTAPPHRPHARTYTTVLGLRPSATQEDRWRLDVGFHPDVVGAGCRRRAAAAKRAGRWNRGENAAHSNAPSQGRAAVQGAGYPSQRARSRTRRSMDRRSSVGARLQGRLADGKSAARGADRIAQHEWRRGRRRLFVVGCERRRQRTAAAAAAGQAVRRNRPGGHQDGQDDQGLPSPVADRRPRHHLGRADADAMVHGVEHQCAGGARPERQPAHSAPDSGHRRSSARSRLGQRQDLVSNRWRPRDSEARSGIGQVLELVTLSRTSDPDPHGMCIHDGYMYYCDAGLTAPGPGSEPAQVCRIKMA